MKITKLCILTMTVVAWTRAAQAQTPKWSMAAQGCVPEPGSISRLVQNATGAVTFAPMAMGAAFVICPVSVFTSTAQCGMRLSLTAADPDGSGATYRARAFLNNLPTGSGPVGSITGVASSSVPKGIDTAAVNSVVDFTSNYYYIVIELFRGNSAANPAFYGVALVDDVCS